MTRKAPHGRISKRERRRPNAVSANNSFTFDPPFVIYGVEVGYRKKTLLIQGKNKFGGMSFGCK
jgi:hypothetical protein